MMKFNLTSLVILLTSFTLIYASALPEGLVGLSKKSPEGSAGLRWGPYEVGPLKLYITNPHTGYAGPKFGVAPHINVHVDRKGDRNKYKEVVNLHVVKYTRGKEQCLYMWDSKSGKTIFDKCFDDWKDAAKEGVETAKEVVDAVMEGIGWLAKIAATVALGIALVAAILLSGLTGVAA